jgi:YVTN family beta-propeller protein
VTNLNHLLLPACLVAFCTGCSTTAPVQPAEKKAPTESFSPRIYVTNEVSGDMTVIDSGTYETIATVPLGKRPRGIRASPDRKTIYVALSGSPIAGPGVDERTLPPPDKSADGIGVFDVAQNNVVRIIKGGSDPENFKSKKVETAGPGKLKVTGDLTINAVTRQVILDLDAPTQPIRDTQGREKIGVSGLTKISRKEFGILYNPIMETGGWR